VTLRVTHTFGHNAGTNVTFSGDVVRFGRAPENEVPFDPTHDRDASGSHAEIRREGGGYVLIDRNSKNGTFVNGARVARHVLRSGDEIGFGTKGPRVRVDFEEPAKAPTRTVAEEGPRTERDPSLTPVVSAPVANAPAPMPHAPMPHAPMQHAPMRPPPAAPPQAFHAPSAPSPHVPAPAAGARVGQRTMAVMIQSAVAAATGRSKPQKTQEIAAIVHREVLVATRGQRRAMVWLGTLMVLLLGGAAALFLWGRQSDDDVSKLRTELASLPPGDARRKEIEGRLGTLHPPNASFGRDLYDRSKKGIFMLSAGGQGFCTAFAVKPSLLATNARCVSLAKRLGGPVLALENEGQGKVSYLVSDLRTHPAYRESDEENLTPDVAVVTISGKAAVVLQLASSAELSTMGVGDAVYVIGFPGRLTDVANPAATFLDGHIGRLTNAAGRPAAFAETWLVQHDAATTRGMSGSPVFNGQGRVVAVNGASYREEDDQTIAGKKTEVVKDSPYKLALRVDLLGALVK
jgi:pSer/pThr/pTyr-binding forkhead associated (FHA) protein